MKSDFEPFRIGTIFNPLPKLHKRPNATRESVTILFPSRLNAMAIDPSKIANNDNLIYTPGEVVFSVKLYREVTVRIVQDSKDIVISSRTKRQPLVRHSYKLMRHVLGFTDTISIDVNSEVEIKHAGLGSSSALIAAVASAINELYGAPIHANHLAKYLAQNHGEEIENEQEYINPVQCIGGSAVSGLLSGAVFIIAGQASVIGSMEIADTYRAVIGIPEDYVPVDSKIALEKEIEFFPRFIETGRKYGQVIAYEMLHKCLPALQMNDLSPLGNLIFDYRFHMGSIENCSFLYTKLPTIANQLAHLKQSEATEVLAISSVGPAFFAITKNPDDVAKAFRDNKLTTYVVDLENNAYTVVG